MTAPFLPTFADTQAARQQLEQLSKESNLPPRLAELMTSLLSQVAEGKVVQLAAVENEVSTQQAADLLGVSRPYLVKMLDKGILPYRKIGPRRRLRLGDVMSYKAKFDAQHQRVLQALALAGDGPGLLCQPQQRQ